MLNGTPSVTTSIGAEGMCGELPWNGFIEDDFQKFTLLIDEFNVVFYILCYFLKIIPLNGKKDLKERPNATFC